MLLATLAIEMGNEAQFAWRRTVNYIILDSSYALLLRILVEGVEMFAVAV